MNSMRGNDEERLDALFRAYRAATPGPDPSVNFMPELWARIDSRRTFTFSFRRMANAFATAAVALSIALGLYMSMPKSNRPVLTQTYVDALADASTPQEFINPVSLELASGR
ncbi:MAG: hypothetical protein JST11_00225 [Acidobacteria bacterium]|nr:hypothetical protein [Acidobacteriota bacterium]